MSILNQNSDFLFLFQATLTNPNGDPDQENKPRMDYETSTLLVSDARRKRDCRDFLKQKGYQIFVNTLDDKKVPMNVMFDHVYSNWFSSAEKIKTIFEKNPDIKIKYDSLIDILTKNDSKNDEKKSDSKKSLKNLVAESKYLEAYNLIKEILPKKGKNYDKDKEEVKKFKDFNDEFLTDLIKRSLIDIRLFGSTMAIGEMNKAYTGPVQVNWGYSLHPVELVKSNTITTIMNDDSSTFGKKYKVHYALVAHHGTINKYSAKQMTGMTENDRKLFRKALIQGMMNNQTDSKQGQEPLLYLEIMYKPDFDGYLGDLRRFIEVSWPGKDNTDNKPIRRLNDLNFNFSKLQEVLNSQNKYIDKIIVWTNPTFKEQFKLEHSSMETVDLFEAIEPFKE